jgi:hypothetical protein
LPETARKLEPLYFEKGQKIGGYTYLPENLRLRLMENVGTLAAKFGISFGTCREGLSRLNTAVCDGSHLLLRI